MGLRGRSVLITAGPTWVPIDSVRIISNIATGVTGTLLAREALARGAKVTLLLGPGCEYNLNNKISIIHFRFFNELKYILKHELRNNKFDIVIHSAAVSDFRPEYKLKGKISSDRVISLNLVPLEKLVVMIRRIAQGAKLVMFKLESVTQEKVLIQRAKSAQQKIGADFIIANRLNPYQAFIINREGNKILARNKQDLAKKLIKILALT